MASKPIVLEIDKVRTAAGTTVVFDNIIPPTTSAGEVLVYNGSTFISDASFASTVYVNNQVTNLIGGASTSWDTLGKVESQMSSSSGAIVSIQSALITKAPLPAIPTPSGEVLTWDGGTFQNDASFAQITYVDAQILSLIDNALTYDTIGKLEAAVQQNESDISTAQSDISTLQADILTKAPLPATPTAAGEVLTFVGGSFLNDSSFATQTFVTAEITNLKNDILGGAGAAYDTLLEIQNELQGNDADIASLLTSMSTKAPKPSVDTAATEVLAWRFGAWVNDPSFAQQSWVDSKILTLIGGATTSFDTLGKIETAIVGNDTDISNIQADLLNKAPLPTGTAGVITWDGSAFQNDSTYAQISFVNNEISNLLGSVSVNYDDLGKIETQLLTNNSDISTAQTDISTIKSDISTIQSNLSLKAPVPPASAYNEFLQWDVTANSGAGGFINTIVSGGGGGSGGGSGVIQVASNTSTGSQSFSVHGLSSKSFCNMVMKGASSKVLFMTSGSAQANGEARMYVYWRSRNSTSDPWSAYSDTNKILVRIYESYTMSEARDSSIAVHEPNLPVGGEVEYRVYFEIVYGTCYYPEDGGVSIKTNMTLLEIAA